MEENKSETRMTARVLNKHVVFCPNWPISARLLQLPSDTCQEVGGSRRMSRVQCAGACGATAGCHSFSFTCADLHLGSSCRCFVCSAADLGDASTSLEATSGVLTSQVRSSFSLTVRSIPCGKFNGLILLIEQVKGEAKRNWVLSRRLSAVLSRLSVTSETESHWRIIY